MEYNLYLVFDISPDDPLPNLEGGAKKGTILYKNSYKGNFLVEELYASDTRKTYKRKSVCIGRTDSKSEALDMALAVMYAFSQGEPDEEAKKAIKRLGEGGK